MCYNTAMEIIRTLNMTAKEYYDYLIDGLYEDVLKSVNKNVKRKDIKKGFSYTKRPGKNGIGALTEIRVTKLDIGKEYQVVAKSSGDTLTVTYKTQVLPNGKLEVRATQEVESYEKEKHKKNKISRGWHELLYGMRLSNTIYEAQTAIDLEKQGREKVEFHLVPKPIREFVNYIQNRDGNK